MSAIRIMSPFSTAFKNASCSFLLKCWISSIIRTGVCPENFFSFARSLIKERISLIWAFVAEIKTALLFEDAIFATVVLPVPGGP